MESVYCVWKGVRCWFDFPVFMKWPEAIRYEQGTELVQEN